MTAVDFIKEKLNGLGLLDKGQVMTNIFEQAKEIEKKQITDSYLIGLLHPIEMPASEQAEEYYNETYGSKGSSVLKEGSGAVGDKGGAVNKGSDNSPKVQNKDSFGGVSSQTEISDIDKKIKSIYDEYSLVEVSSSWISKTFYNGIEKGYKKCLENISQTEISDEEIENEADHYKEANGSYSFKMAIKWYREQLKSK